jgi:hypothetical protein
MAMKKLVGAALALMVTALLAGCGGGVQQSSSPSQRQVPGVATQTSTRQVAGQATVEEVKYHNWPALRLTNGVVTVLVIPDIGGRILEYKLDAHPDELGKSYNYADIVSGDVATPDYGGYHAVPIMGADGTPSRDLGKSPLVSGVWTYEILTGRGQKAEVRLTSPSDATGTGLQITRNVVLYAGSTKVRITERFQNVGEAPVSFAIKHIAQVRASLSNEQKFSKEAKVYFPLNPDSKHGDGFVSLASGGSDQFKTIEDGTLMEVSAGGAQGAVGADSTRGWAAYMDTKNKYAFVNRFSVNRIEDYPEQNSSVTVRTSDSRSFMALGISSAVTTISARDTAESYVEWYATRVEPPIRDVTEVAAIHEAPQVTKTAQEFRIKASLGVFATGEVHALLKNIDNIPVGETVKIPARPTEVTVIDKGIPLENRAASVVIELNNQEGSPLGEIASTSVAPALAAAEKAEAEGGLESAPTVPDRERVDLGIKARGEARPTSEPPPGGTEL